MFHFRFANGRAPSSARGTVAAPASEVRSHERQCTQNVGHLRAHSLWRASGVLGRVRLRQNTIAALLVRVAR